MAKKIISDQGWSIPPSYDLGIKPGFWKLLDGNPVRKRFFRQWLARFDHENMRNYYNYETGKGRPRGDMGPEEIHYDQVARMVYSANLPLPIEKNLFYHLDYYVNRENDSINFLRLKEFFAYCGIDGVYDFEKRKHHQLEFDPPYTLENLKINGWPEDKRERYAEDYVRMMANPGEVPHNSEIVAKLQFEYRKMWAEDFTQTALYREFMNHADSLFEGTDNDPERIQVALEEARKRGQTLDDYDDQIAEYTAKFNQNPAVAALLDEIEQLEKDEAAKLKAAMAKYAPPGRLDNEEYLKSFDADIGKWGFDWMDAEATKLLNSGRWATRYIGHKTYETCSNEPPTEEEAKGLNKELIRKGLYSQARFKKLKDDFNINVWPKIRERACAIEDWILREYSMSSINRGYLAEQRRESIPEDFKYALKLELEEGLLNQVNFPIRMEKLDDDSGQYKLFLYDHAVEIFHPDEILVHKSLAYPEQLPGHASANSPDPQPEDIIDFKLNLPAIDMDDPKAALNYAPAGPEESSNKPRQSKPGKKDWKQYDRSAMNEGAGKNSNFPQYAEQTGGNIGEKHKANRLPSSLSHESAAPRHQFAGGDGGGWSASIKFPDINIGSLARATDGLKNTRKEFEGSKNADSMANLDSSLKQMETELEAFDTEGRVDKNTTKDLSVAEKELKRCKKIMEEEGEKHDLLKKMAKGCREQIERLLALIERIKLAIMAIFGRPMATAP